MIAIFLSQALVHIAGNNLDAQHQNVHGSGQLWQLQPQARNRLMPPKDRLFFATEFPLTEAGGTEGNGQQGTGRRRNGGHAKQTEKQPEPTEAICPGFRLGSLGA